MSQPAQYASRFGHEHGDAQTIIEDSSDVRGDSGIDSNEQKASDPDSVPVEGGKTCLNLVIATYAPSWKPSHGWRELFQNWLVDLAICSIPWFLIKSSTTGAMQS